MPLSRKAKEAIKTALAITIAYGIALSMDWDKPYWAGFAVAFVSLASIGQSINKAALRVAGTVTGTVAALVLLALFAQDRWPFVLFLSLWLFMCTYLMGGNRVPYFWQVSGLVCVVVCMGAGPDPVHAFEIAVLRSQETGLGVLVYSLVAILLWPINSRAAFSASVRQLATTRQQQFQAYFELLLGHGDEGQARALMGEALREQTRFGQLLTAAESDSSRVRESRAAWRRYQARATELGETLERWREGFTDLQTADLPQLLPGLEMFRQEIERRLSRLTDVADTDPAGQLPAPRIELSYNREAVLALPHFQRAALAVSRRQLLQIEALTRELCEISAELRVHDRPATLQAATATTGTPTRFVPDPERGIAATQVVLILWTLWLANIYIDDIPGGTGLLSMAVPIGMVLVSTPQLALTKLFLPITNSVLLAALLYIFVMPKLDGFAGLGTLIFLTTFTICYLYAEPRQMLGRAFGLAMFLAIAGISNQQVYSFLAVANTAMMFPIIFLVFAIITNLPFTSRPERIILGLLERFFRSSGYLMSGAGQARAASAANRLAAWKHAFHERELGTLPQKMAVWIPLLDRRQLAGTSVQQLQDMVSGLQALGCRIRDLRELQGRRQAPGLVEELREDFLAWHTGVREALRKLARNPAAGRQDLFRQQLDALMQHLETRIRQSMDRTREEQLDSEARENFYQLLGAYRGVSEAIVDYAGSAGGLDWERWREERFA